MKVLQIAFILLAFSTAKILVITEGGEAEITFPTFTAPDFQFIDLSGGCGGFTDCIEYVGAVLYNIGLGIIFLVVLLANLITYIFEIIVLLIEIQFLGVEGAPWWINTLMSFPLLAGMGFIIFKLVRSGKSES